MTTEVSLGTHGSDSQIEKDMLIKEILRLQQAVILEELFELIATYGDAFVLDLEKFCIQYKIDAELLRS